MSPTERRAIRKVEGCVSGVATMYQWENYVKHIYREDGAEAREKQKEAMYIKTHVAHSILFSTETQQRERKKEKEGYNKRMENEPEVLTLIFPSRNSRVKLEEEGKHTWHTPPPLNPHIQWCCGKCCRQNFSITETNPRNALFSSNLYVFVILWITFSTSCVEMCDKKTYFLDF